MNIRKLEVFLDLSETLSYSETAYRLFTTQGNISKIIKSLEEELGIQLFERSHRNIVMTESAKEILIYARDIVSQNNQLIETINGMNNKNGSQIQLDTIPTMPSYKSFSILSKFMAKNHQINFKLTETEGSVIFDKLKNEETQIIFTRVFEEITELDSVLIDEDDFVLVSPSSRDLNNQEKYIDISELANESFILLNEQTNLYKPVINLFEKSGITPDIFYKGNRFDLISEMVAEGMGLSIVPRKIAENMTSNKIKIIDIIESPQSRLGF